MKKIYLCLLGLLVPSLLTGCNNGANNYKFANKITYIKSGDKVTLISEKGKNVVYMFQNGTPEGVTLDMETGLITYDENGPVIPETVYIAACKNTPDVYTIIHFGLNEEIPTLKFNNVSSYLINGDLVSASASSASGRNYGVSYELKNDVPGISVNSSSGLVKYSSHVKDQTKFTVLAKCKKVEIEKEFIAMTEGVITAKNDTQIVKYGSDEIAKFVLDFDTNTQGDIETTSENIGYSYDGVIYSHPDGMTYNQSTKEVTFSKKIISTLSKGENEIKILTQRNPVTVNLVVCDNFIHSAKEFADAFEANYTYATPKFKTGSLSAYYVLANDIDMTEYLNGEGYNNGKGWNPIGAYNDLVFDIPFTGTFNGNGHTISGFTYKHGSPAYICGLFGRSSGTIKNFTLKGAIPSMSSWSAAVCANNSGTIENVIVDVEMPNGGQYATGTICSVNHGLITNCLSISENVKGYTNVQQSWQRAGIALGLNETDGTITKTFAVGDSTNYTLFGWSQTPDVTLEKAGILFDSLDAMKSYDFSNILNADAFNFEEGKLPTLKVGA